MALRPLRNPEALERSWRELEERADASPFQRWSWVGCLAAERFSDPVLLEARARGRVVALALCNRVRGRLLLHETGSPRWDGLFVEHNGPLIERGREAELLPPLLAALASTPIAPARRGGARRVVLGGVSNGVLDAARGRAFQCAVQRSRPAPFIDLAGLSEGSYAASLGRSTRATLGRSRRDYAARGPLAVRGAADVDEGLRFLDALVALHQASWNARGEPGAFASAHIVRFHRALVARALPRGEVELLRVSAGQTVIGWLYNLRSGGWVCNYQGGFDYAGAGPHGRPGLTCHELAIEAYRADGARVYDFLAGEDRYKRSLASAQAVLHWAEIAPAGSLAGVLLAVRQAARTQFRRARAVSAQPPTPPE